MLPAVAASNSAHSCKISKSSPGFPLTCTPIQLPAVLLKYGQDADGCPEMLAGME